MEFNCPKCARKNSKGARFCQYCGTSIPRHCSNCQAQVYRDAQFCNQCGSELESPQASAIHREIEEKIEDSPGSGPDEGKALDGKRRPVTIVFSDLTGYTRLNEQLDPESVNGIMRSLRDGAVKIVESQGGIVNQFVGDEVVALFGLPIAHEDDPRRAVRAGLAIHRMVKDYRSQHLADAGISLQMHTGITTGLIVAVREDGREGSYGITGDAVNTAARLTQLANPDEIVICPETRQLISPYFMVETLKPVELKGKSEEITPYRITGESVIQTRFEASERRGFSPFVGRRGDVAKLREGLKKASGGNGKFFTVSGDTGVGKSRLFHEFTQKLDESDCLIWRGFCQPDEQQTPYRPWIEVLNASLGLPIGERQILRPEKLIDKVLEIDPGLEGIVPFLLHVYSLTAKTYPLPKGIQGEKLSLAIRMSFAQMVAASARKKPLILLLHDWQWADAASDSVLKYLVGMISDQGVLMLVNYRADFHPDWGNHVHHSHITLKPLQDRQILRIVKHMFGAKYVPESLSRLIQDRTDGNPFFVEETCRSLLEHGTVTRKDVKEADIKQKTEELKLPGTVQAVIRSRLDRLERDVQEVLTLASVIGGQFSGAILERLYPNTEALYRHIGRLQELEIVEQVQFFPDPVFRFRQIPFQEVAYTGLLLQQSKALHLRVAEAIKSLYGDNLTVHHGQLGRHLFAADSWEKSITHLSAAAKRASSLSAYREAGELLEQALKAVEQMPPNEKRERLAIDLSLDLRHVLFPQRQFKKIDELLETSRQTAFRLDDPARGGQVLTYQIMAFLGTGRYREALKAGSEALGIANRIKDGAMRKDILFQLIQAYVSQGDFSLAVSNALKLIDESEQSEASGNLNGGESIQTTLARTWVVWLLAELGAFEEARAKLTEYASRFEGNGNALHDVLLRLARGLLSLRKGCYEAAVETLEPALAACGEASMMAWRAAIASPLGYALGQLGNIEKALELSELAVAQTVASRGSGHIMRTINLGELYLLAGRVSDAKQLANETMQLAEDFEERSHLAYALRLMGKVRMASGGKDAENALDCLERAFSLAGVLGLKPLQARLLRDIADFHTSQGRNKEAEDASRQALKIATPIRLVDFSAP